jgi:hypothetical protein
MRLKYLVFFFAVMIFGMTAFADTTPPTVNLVIIAGPPQQFQFTIQDIDSGLASIVVTESNNADTVVPPFVIGTTDPVTVLGTKIDQTRFATIEILVTDVDGNVNDFRYDESAVNSVPEPGSIALIGSGVLGLAGRLRRRRRS